MYTVPAHGLKLLLEDEEIPLCPCSGTTAQYGGGGACVPYIPVPCSGTTAQYGGGACVPYVLVVVLQHSMEEEHVSPMSL